jgi:hypothetical protein
MNKKTFKPFISNIKAKSGIVTFDIELFDQKLGHSIMVEHSAEYFLEGCNEDAYICLDNALDSDLNEIELLPEIEDIVCDKLHNDGTLDDLIQDKRESLADYYYDQMRDDGF